jgi:hypothetical protein
MAMAILVASLIAIALLFALAKKSGRSSFKARIVLSAPEQALYHRLKEALPDYEVLAQVAFSQLLTTAGGSKKENWAKFATARQKVADFIICRKDFSIAAAIELDDKSHDIGKDLKRDRMLEEAGIPTIRWNVRNLPNAKDIVNQVSQRIKNE